MNSPVPLEELAQTRLQDPFNPVILHSYLRHPMTQTTYRVIGFGKTQNGFFNEPTYCTSIGNACAVYDAHLHNPEMDGAVIVRVNHEDWEVIQEFCSEQYLYAVVYGPVGNLRVELSPELVII